MWLTDLFYPLSSQFLCKLADINTRARDQICRYLAPSNVCALAQTSQAVYRSIQTPLYHHPHISSFKSLTLLIRTLNHMKSRTWGSSKLSILKEIVRMHITVDPTKEVGGQSPAAVLLSRMVTIVSQYVSSFQIRRFFISAYICADIVLKLISPFALSIRSATAAQFRPWSMKYSPG